MKGVSLCIFDKDIKNEQFGQRVVCKQRIDWNQELNPEARPFKELFKK